MYKPIAKTALTLTASFLFLAGTAAADTWNKKTYVTFPNTVELPGRVMLPPGTYTMKLVDSSSNRFIVQVSNRDENKVFATFHTIPQYRDRPADKTIITFYETPGSHPRFIHTWYYPGDTTGREFMYGKDRAEYIASLRNTRISEEQVVATRETTRTEETAQLETPEQRPEERIAGGGDPTPAPAPAISEEAPEPAPAPAPEPAPAAEEQAPAAEQPAPQVMQQPAAEPRTLPSTSSELPLVALAGITLLALGTIMRKGH